MQKSIPLFIIIFFLASCRNIGDYYADVNDDNIEDIQLNDDRESRYIAFISNIIDSNFNAQIYFKVIDQIKHRNCVIKQITLSINGISDSVAQKKLLSINSPGEITYKNLDEITDLTKKIESSLPIQFLFIYDKNIIPERKVINVSIKIYISENGENSVIEKKFKMKKHRRYKSKFVS